MKYQSYFSTWFVAQYGKRPELSMGGSEAVKWDRERDTALKGWCAGRTSKRAEHAGEVADLKQRIHELEGQLQDEQP